MDIHAEYLDVAGLLRASADSAARGPGAISESTSVIGQLKGIADTIDPNGYSRATQGVSNPGQGLDAAIAKLDAIPDDIRPTTASPMRDQLTQLTRISAQLVRHNLLLGRERRGVSPVSNVGNGCWPPTSWEVAAV